ncbi:MAG TPA: LytTR family DNA-binding domain-containing protein [Puia sp.]|nr:LytTR family DNA-binding domain-containing protein [Puia sp.]
MVKAILIDDEQHCLETLGLLLARHCPDVEIIETCRTAEKGMNAIEKFKPDIVFLDIEMPVMNGFEMIERCGEINFEIIFTTSYDQYAIKAIKLSALDYLLKPIVPKELIAAVQKISRQPMASGERLELLLDRIKNKENTFSKIAIPTATGFEMIPADQILYCEVDDNYTHITSKGRKAIMACRSLKEIEEQLKGFGYFVRVHNSFVINLNEVEKYNKGEGGYVVMSDGKTIDVSRTRKDFFLKKVMRG